MPLPSSQPVPTPIPDDPPEPRWMYVTLTADGAATLTIGATQLDLPPAADLDSGRRQMIAELRKAAAQLDGGRVWVEITDPDGVWPTEVPADGPLLALDKGPTGRGLTPAPHQPPRSPPPHGPPSTTSSPPAPTPTQHPPPKDSAAPCGNCPGADSGQPPAKPNWRTATGSGASRKTSTGPGSLLW
jgi:hypothetical protein